MDFVEKISQIFSYKRIRHKKSWAILQKFLYDTKTPIQPNWQVPNSFFIPKYNQLSFTLCKIERTIWEKWDIFFHKIHTIAASPCPMDQKAFASPIDNESADLHRTKNVFSVISWAKQVSKTYWNFLNFPTFVSSSRASSFSITVSFLHFFGVFND